jgi:hypothetical protein
MNIGLPMTGSVARINHSVFLEPNQGHREIWTIKVSAPFLIGAVKSQIAHAEAQIESLNASLERLKKQLEDRDSARFAAIRSMFRFKDLLFYRSVRTEWDIDEQETKLSELNDWLRFLSAMPFDSGVSLDQQDFAYFFPGDLYQAMNS